MHHWLSSGNLFRHIIPNPFWFDAAVYSVPAPEETCAGVLPSNVDVMPVLLRIVVNSLHLASV